MPDASSRWPTSCAVDGINVILDQYVHPAPEEGWPRWMDRNLDEAQFVLMVCTETYRRRVMGREEPGKGHGVRWEGSLIYNRIYNDKPSGSRFIPILLLPGSEPCAHPQPRSGACLLSDHDVRPHRPGFRGLVPAPDRSGPTPRPTSVRSRSLPPKPRPRTIPGPSLTPSTTGGDASGGSWWNIRGSGRPASCVVVITISLCVIFILPVFYLYLPQVGHGGGSETSSPPRPLFLLMASPTGLFSSS